MRRRVLTQKPVLIMKSSIEAPIEAETSAIFTYHSKNFILAVRNTNLSYQQLQVKDPQSSDKAKQRIKDQQKYTKYKYKIRYTVVRRRSWSEKQRRPMGSAKG